jgi:hypothetical protein
MTHVICGSLQNEFTVAPDFRAADMVFCSCSGGARFLHQ